MTTILYGHPPPVFDPPSGAIQTSPLSPGARALEDLEPGSIDRVCVLAPPGVLERAHVLGLTLRALRPGGRLDVMAAKDRGGSRLGKELKAFGVDVAETAKAHHRRCEAARPDRLHGLEDAIAAGAPRIVEALKLWSQPGVFAWDRVDAGSDLLVRHLPPLKGRGIDLGCGHGALSLAILASAQMTELTLVDRDRRAVEAARRNVTDARARFDWTDARHLTEVGDLDFVVSNPPFHDGGTEDRRLGQAFVRKAAGLLKRGGRLWLVANRHLPYEADLRAAFARVSPVVEAQGYKVFEAVK